MADVQVAQLPAAEYVSLCETLDRVLHAGLAVAGEVTLSVSSVDLIGLGLQLALSTGEPALLVPSTEDGDLLPGSLA